MKRSLRSTTWLFLTALLAAPAAAGGLDDFKLTRAVPADAVVAIHTRGHEGQAWLNQQFARVWTKIEESKFDKDIRRALKAATQDSGMTPERFDELWQKIVDLGAAVDWASLGDREYAFGMKLTFPTPEFVSIMQPPADKVQSSFDGLSGIVKALAGMNTTDLVLSSEGEGETVIHKLAWQTAPDVLKDGRVTLTLARQKDVILIGFGPTLVEQSLALLQGKPGKTLASSQRFQDAFKKLPPPTDSATFLDIALLMTQVRGMIGDVIKMADAQGNAPAEGTPDYEKYQKGKKIPGKVVDLLDIFEYSAAVASTQGKKTDSTEITLLKADAKDKPFYKMMMNNGTLKDPLKIVPKDASNFSITSGIDVAALWNWLTTFIKEDVPDSEEFFTGLEEMKKETGFDVEADFISWIKGGIASVSIPGPTPYAQGEWSIMLSVRDEAKANATLKKLIEMGRGMLSEDQGSIDDAEIEGAPGFYTARIAQLGFFGAGKPTVGVKDGWLTIASGPEFVGTLMGVSGGKADNISKSERFQKEGLQPSGATIAVSFTDLSNLGEELATAFGMISMIGSMAPPEVSKNPAIGALLGVAGKVGRIARELNFFQSSASTTTVDGNSLTTRSVTTYREPPAAEKPKAQGTSEEKKSE